VVYTIQSALAGYSRVDRAEQEPVFDQHAFFSVPILNNSQSHSLHEPELGRHVLQRQLQPGGHE
jgi:hypothetical protein